ncbi:Predicted arabinose efflux permease, MFS family [Rathayibacter oskolensis]|uniref:Predicted arabinose efflux permease, MFS family n=1 Tax=Rathayibacter oskolensis TaxID=1891671 RepID=A0A1X7N642_9MICO|nr:MFS transporter [Rathayibacter oskolensis]SMH32230.1 Predicted arabinose efflux permease, MFS family [Rathayibacter oskolensis]
MPSTASVPVVRPDQATRRFPYVPLVALMLLSFLLVTAEFLPNGVLTEMAAGLDVTPGQAGQTVTVTALVGLVVAPTVGLMFPRLDRRTLLIGTAVAAGASSVLAGLAPTLPLVLLSRLLLGAAISAFWSMSITVAARVAGPDRVGRATMFTSAGLSLATVAGVPLGVILSELVDWRAAFVLIGVLTALLAVPLRLLLPSVPAAPAAGLGVLLDTVRRRGVRQGFAGHILVVLGHFLAYTYIRLALERTEGTDAATIVALLALFGAGGLVGNIVIGSVIDRSFAFFGVVAPVAIAIAVGGVLLLPGSVAAIAVAVFVWGFFFASWLIIVNAWVGHRMTDRLEAGGSLVVVGFQAAIVIAAGLGGVLVDAVGVEADYVIGAVLLLVGAALFGSSNRRRSV